MHDFTNRRDRSRRPSWLPDFDNEDPRRGADPVDPGTLCDVAVAFGAAGAADAAATGARALIASRPGFMTDPGFNSGWVDAMEVLARAGVGNPSAYCWRIALIQGLLRGPREHLGDLIVADGPITYLTAAFMHAAAASKLLDAADGNRFDMIDFQRIARDPQIAQSET